MPTSTRFARAASDRFPEHGKPRYVSTAETRQLLSQGEAARAARLQAEDMVTPVAAAKAAGVTVATVRAWMAAGRAISLSVPRNAPRLPRWQFEPALWDALPRLSAALNSAGPWRVLSFLETPLGGLGGLTPRLAIERGELQRVLELAAEEA